MRRRGRANLPQIVCAWPPGSHQAGENVDPLIVGVLLLGGPHESGTHGRRHRRAGSAHGLPEDLVQLPHTRQRSARISTRRTRLGYNSGMRFQ
jgi:hypothetical protein